MNLDEKRSIESMRNNMLKREDKSVFKFPINGIMVLSELVKKQNIILLKKIANDKFLTEEEKNCFINKYSKVNFYSPEINNIKKENNQKYI
tara:strand:- start:12 stop:284 length:273 start_codon:yes stop_codon:yes gene_type:complete